MERNKNIEQEVFEKIIRKIKKDGKISAPRGLKVLEIENFHFDFPPYVRFMNFKDRKLNIPYIKEEFKWYLKGDRFDDSIGKHAKLWNEIKNKDGSINSNYGQYIFGEQRQFERVFNLLKKDSDSRQALIVILNNDHLNSDTKDYPCTSTIGFRIRQNKLNMTVHMRSMDAIYGAGNDFPTFSFIHEMMFNMLKHFYKNLQYGTYHHMADSFHVYEKHFDMLDKIVKGICSLEKNFEKINCPKMNGIAEIVYMMNAFSNKTSFDYPDDKYPVPKEFKFYKWLTS